VNPIPIMSVSPLNAASCVPAAVDFTSDSAVAIPGSAYSWTFGDGSNSSDMNPSHLYTDAGQYSVSLTITSPAGCSNDTIIVNLVEAYALPDANFEAPEEVTMTDAAPVTMSNSSTGSVSWDWNFGDGGTGSGYNPTHVYTDTGLYTIQLISTSPAGCVDTTYRTIYVTGEFAIYIPNAFSPNGDGINDKFSAFGIYIHDYDMWILDRWGGKIFHSTDINNPWNGTYFDDGTLCQNGVYVYKIKAHDNQGKLHEFVGSVTLAR